MGAGAWKVFSAMDDGARAAVVKELGLAAKAFVMSPAFAASHDQYLKSAHNAVNHGMPVSDPEKEMMDATKSTNPEALESSMNKMMRDMYRKQVMERLPSINGYTKDMIGIMAEADLGMMDSSAPANASEKANVAKAKAMLAEARKLAATDLDKAKSTYKSALMLAAGLANESQAAAGVEEGKKQDQQRNYNRLALKPMRKSEFWKMLYRLGPGGTNAAIGVAQTWIAEL